MIEKLIINLVIYLKIFTSVISSYFLFQNSTIDNECIIFKK
jgi:hypothetical protein